MEFTTKTSGDWNSGTTWGTPNNTYPGPEDDVVITSFVVAIPKNFTATIGSSGSLTINSGGGLAVSGALKNAGTIVAQAEIAIQSGGWLENSGTMSGSGFINNFGSLTNTAAGAITNSAGSSNFFNQAGCTAANAGMLNLNGGFANYGTVNNTGTINLTASANLTNSGTLANSGTMNLNGVSSLTFEANTVTGSLTSTGIFIQNPGSTISLGTGTQATVKTSGGAFSIPAGVTLVVGQGASLSISSASTLNNAGTILDSGAAQTTAGIVVAGALNNSGTLTLIGTDLGVYALNITPTGTLNNTGALNLNNLGQIVFTGNFAGSEGGSAAPEIFDSIRSQGQLVQGAGSVMNLGSGTELVLGWDGAQCWFAVPLNATLNVNGGATLTLEGNATLYNYGTVNNNTGYELTVAVGRGLGHPVKAVVPAGDILNDEGEIINYGTFTNGQSASILPSIPTVLQAAIDNTGAVILNEPGATFTNYGSICNENGVITNNGTFHKDSGKITGVGVVDGSNPPQP